MSDITLANDIILGIGEALGDAGWLLKLRSIEYGQVDINNPGAGAAEIVSDVDFDGLVFDYDEKYMPGTTVIDGDKMVLGSVEKMTQEQVSNIKPGNYIIDGSETYSIIKASPIKVAGLPVVVIAQVKS